MVAASLLQVLRWFLLLLLLEVLVRVCNGASPPPPPPPPLPPLSLSLSPGPENLTRHGSCSGASNHTLTTSVDGEGGDGGGGLTEELLSFLIGLTQGGQLYLVHDGDLEGVRAAERVWRRADRPLTLLPYEPELTLLTEALKSPRHHVLPFRRVLVICDPEHVARIFRQVRSYFLESRTTQWLVVTSAGHLMETLAGELREGTQVAVAVAEGPCKARLYSSRVVPDGGIGFQFVGVWTGAAARLRGQLLPDLPALYSNLHGRHLLVTTNDNWPFMGINTLDNGTVIPISGVDLQVITTLSLALNFTYHLIRPPDGQWGGPQPDGTVSGIIGQVHRHEAHVTLCELSITSSRETVVDFTAPYYMESTTLVSGAPKEKTRTFAVFSPFRLEVWLCIVAAVLAAGPFLYVVTRLVVHLLDHPDQRRYTPHDLTFHMYRNLMVQNNLIDTTSWVLKLLFFTWYLFSFYIYAMYSGTLTAVLAIPAFEKPIDSLQQLPEARSRGYIIATTRSSSFEDTLKTASAGIYREVWLLMNHEDRDESFMHTPQDGIDMILKREYFVFIHAQLTSLMKATQTGQREKFHLARQTFLPQSYGIACNTGSPLRDAFSNVLLRLTEGGLVYKWAGDELSRASSNNTAATTTTTGPPAITLQHLQAAFFLLTLGWGTSAAVLGGEVVASRWRHEARKGSYIRK